MKVQTINSIEIASVCNNKCPYCPAKDQGKYRKTGLMGKEVFEKSIEWVRFFAQKGTQREVNLFGVGEPTLHPDLVEMVRYARERIPFRIPLHLNTNGNLMTLELAIKLRHAGVSHMDITGHDHYHTAKTIEILRKAGIVGNLTYDFVTRPNNWAGQVDWFQIPKETYDPGVCPWIDRGQVMIMSDGNITRCCIDAFARGIMGSVWDDVEGMEVSAFDLCRSCHHSQPAGLIKMVRG